MQHQRRDRPDDGAYLSERYITDRFLPDKAIDLLDEACSCAVLRNKRLSEYDRAAKEMADKTEALEELEGLDAESQPRLRGGSPG